MASWPAVKSPWGVGAKTCPQGVREKYIPFYEERGTKVIFDNAFLFYILGGKACMRESEFQAKLIRELKELFPGCIVTKNESYIRGFPDLTIYYRDKWATLECKRSRTAEKQPLQEHYVTMMDGMSFSRFIYPENKEEVLHDLQRAFEV